jgi:hypothetical protein
LIRELPALLEQTRAIDEWLVSAIGLPFLYLLIRNIALDMQRVVLAIGRGKGGVCTRDDLSSRHESRRIGRFRGRKRSNEAQE